MRRTHVTAVLVALALVVPATSQAAYFHSDFDEASLPIAGLNQDTPLPASNNYSLNTTNETLDFVDTASANMWGGRDNAPIAWVASPTVANGETWSVETYVSMQKGGSNNEEIAGITFYQNSDGGNPDFLYGLHDWGGWSARLQGSADNNPNVTGADLGTATGVFLLVEITEGGATDTYNFFYKVNSGDAWIQLGGAATNMASNAPNARAGLFLKNDGSGGGAAQYDYLTVTPEPGTMAVLALGGLAVLRRRRR